MIKIYYYNTPIIIIIEYYCNKIKYNKCRSKYEVTPKNTRGRNSKKIVKNYWSIFYFLTKVLQPVKILKKFLRNS